MHTTVLGNLYQFSAHTRCGSLIVHTQAQLHHVTGDVCGEGTSVTLRKLSITCQ